MGFIENMRNAVSNWADSMTGQENTYHRSTGKTQKEYENDINTYKALEAGLIADSILSAAGLGAGIAVPVLGTGTAGTAAATTGSFFPEIIGDAGIALTNPAVAAAGTATSTAPIIPAGLAALTGGAGGAGLGGLLTTGEKIVDAETNGVVDDRDIKKDISNDSGDVKPVEAGEREEEKKEEKKEEEKKSPDYDIDEMAGEFILGAWGNGQDRIDNMIGAGYTLDDYNKIQQRVNEAYASGRDLHEWTNKANAKLHYW